MYALVDPKSFWPQQLPATAVPQPLPSNQIYMTPVPVTPTYLIGGTAAPPTHALATMASQQSHHQQQPTTSVFPAGAIGTAAASATSPATPALYYSLQPSWAHHQHHYQQNQQHQQQSYPQQHQQQQYPQHHQQQQYPQQHYQQQHYQQQHSQQYYAPAPAPLPITSSTTRPRMPSDDVFIVETPNPQTYTLSVSTATNGNKTCTFRPIRRQRMVGAADEDDLMSLESTSSHHHPYRHQKNETRRGRQRSNSFTASSDSSSCEFSPQRSQISGRSSGRSCGRSSGSSSVRLSISPQHHVTNRHDSMDQSASSGSHKEAPSVETNDFSLFNLFSTSLYSALNRDPPDPTSINMDSKNNFVIPLKTSSPIKEEKKEISDPIPVVPEKQKKTQIAASEHDHVNGNQENVDGDNILDGQQGSRRQKFLQALEEERERQRCLVLPKHAPKMNCKFCKNNGECLEVYTKHRLHFKEKTVCPLLRMYVCRLCNSTGDFAHTIRHCPFNSRFDKIAWKATFL